MGRVLAYGERRRNREKGTSIWGNTAIPKYYSVPKTCHTRKIQTGLIK